MSLHNNNNAPSPSPGGIVPNTITIHLKSGQSWDELLSRPISSSLSLLQLKATLSHHLGDTPSPSNIVLAFEQGGGLVELKEGDISAFQNEKTLFVFSSKSWKAHCIIQGTSSTTEDRRNAVLETSSHDSFLHQLRQVQQASLMENDAIQAARKLLAERAALFRLQENRDIDQKGDCQFDAAADQLRKYQQFAGETKDYVRARVVKWIRDNAGRDLGHGTIVKQWVEESLLEYVSFDDYLEKMAREQWWGDEVTLLAICELHQVAIVMLSSVQGGNWYRTIYPAGKSEKDELPQLWLGHEHERHYWSLVEDIQVLALTKKKEIPTAVPKEKSMEGLPPFYTDWTTCIVSDYVVGARLHGADGSARFILCDVSPNGSGTCFEYLCPGDDAGRNEECVRKVGELGGVVSVAREGANVVLALASGVEINLHPVEVGTLALAQAQHASFCALRASRVQRVSPGWKLCSHPLGVLSNSDLTWTKTGGTGWNCSFIGSTGWSTGRHEWSVKLENINHHTMIGVAPGSINRNTYNHHTLGLGIYTTSGGVYSAAEGQNRGYGPVCQAAGSVIRVCLDWDARTVSFTVNSKDYGVAFTKLPSEPLYPWFEVHTSGDSFTVFDIK